jgi:hypothetical protein
MSRAAHFLVGAVLLAACGCSGSGSRTPGSGGGGGAAGTVAERGGAGGLGLSGGAGAAGGGTAGAGTADTAGTAGTGGAGTAGTGGAGMAGGGASGGAVGAGGAGGSGQGGSNAGGAGGSGAAGSGAAGSGTGGSGTVGSSGTAGGAGAGGSSGSCLPHDIDLQVAQLSGEITVQGGTGLTGSATLDLRTAAGDSALLASTPPGGTSIIQLVLPGTYDIYYRYVKAGPGLPVNQSAKIQSGVVIAPGGQTLDVVVPATPVSVALTSNGSTPPGFAGDSIHLRTAAGDDAPLGTSATPVVPGTYDVYYVPASFTAGPINQSAKLQSGFVVGASPLTLNVEVPRTTVSGTFTLNGSKTPPAGNSTDAYGLSLVTAAGDRAGIAQQLGAYTATIIPGTYDLHFNTSVGAAGLNPYPSTLLQRGIVAGSSPLTLNVDVPTTTVSGTITVNGAQVASTAGLGKLTLQNATTTWTFAATTSDAYSSTPAGAYSTAIVPGTYDLYYSVITVGTGVPSNASVKLRGGVVIGTTSPQTLDIDIPATTVTGTITVNGAQVDASMGTGGLHLRNAAGDDALIGTTGVVGAYSQLVVAGTYDLYYAFISGGTGVPMNQSAKLRSVTVVGSTPLALDIDVSAPMVSGTISQLEVQSSGTPSKAAILILQTASGDKASLGSAFSTTYARYVIAGTYELMYSAQQAVNFGIPRNTLGDLGCYGVP